MTALIDQRLHLNLHDRLSVVAMIGGTIGATLGLYEGIKLSSLRFLAENAHRLPRTVGGWYFYHKRKNYVMISNGCRQAAKTGFKFSAFLLTFFALEAGLDWVRETTDFANTTLSGGLLSYGYGTYKRMGSVLKRKLVKRGTSMSLALGLVEDFLIYQRGGDLWYFNRDTWEKSDRL